jgi:hypothetical protein
VEGVQDLRVPDQARRQQALLLRDRRHQLNSGASATYRLVLGCVA